MGIRMTKRWITLEPDGDEVTSVAAAAALPAQLGVFELADTDATVVLIGSAGGREPFGLRTAVATALDEHRALRPRLLRYEITHAYRSRHRELLMLHLHDTGRLPAGNHESTRQLGRLRPGPAPAGAGRGAGADAGPATVTGTGER